MTTYTFTFEVSVEEGVIPQTAYEWLKRTLEGDPQELPEYIYSVQTIPSIAKTEY